MLAHEQYQELCAAASIGQANAEELVLLERHLRKCSLCRRTYSEFANIAAREYAANFAGSPIFQAEAQQFAPLEVLEERFLKRAKEEAFSPDGDSGSKLSRSPSWFYSRRWPTVTATKWTKRLGAAAAISAMLLVVAYAYRLGRSTGETHSVAVKSNIAQAQKSTAPMSLGVDLVPSLEQEVSRLQRSLAIARAQSQENQAVADSLSQEKQALLSRQSDQDHVISQLQQELNETEDKLRASRDEAGRAWSALADQQASSTATEVRIRHLTDEVSEKTDELDRERQLLEGDRDIRDLMVARNLHIFDVFDTDAKGKTKPAFGRVFYTEGKSLVFYAYDLDDVGIRNAKYHYRVWGSREGNDDKAMSLGIFYSDDKSQRRWVFKCDDPRILSQIDSVFVTLEPGLSPLHPKGQKLLDAYLRGIPNHP